MSRSGTKTGNALEYLRDHVMIPEKGLRNNVPQNILLFTDGKPTDNPIPVANELKKKFNVRKKALFLYIEIGLMTFTREILFFTIYSK